jgi:hypothetical protein
LELAHAKLHNFVVSRHECSGLPAEEFLQPVMPYISAAQLKQSNADYVTLGVLFKPIMPAFQ